MHTLYVYCFTSANSTSTTDVTHSLLNESIQVGSHGGVVTK